MGPAWRNDPSYFHIRPGELALLWTGGRHLRRAFLGCAASALPSGVYLLTLHVLGVWAREMSLLGFLLGLPAQVCCLLSPRRLQCREGLQLGWESQEEPMGRRALWGEGGKGPIGKKQLLSRLGGRPGCPHLAPLWLSTHGPHLSPPNLGYSPQAPPDRHPCLCPTIRGPHQSNQCLHLSPSIKIPCPSFSHPDPGLLKP